MLIEGCKTISATPSKAGAKLQLFFELCKFFGQKKATHIAVSR